jgi:hypothetical protein
LVVDVSDDVVDRSLCDTESGLLTETGANAVVDPVRRIDKMNMVPAFMVEDGNNWRDGAEG